MAAPATTPWGRAFGIGPVAVLSNYDPGSTPTTYNLDLAPYTPKGTKAVQLSMRGYNGSGTTRYEMGIRKTGGSVNVLETQAAHISGGSVHGWIELDANRTCDLWFEHADWVTVYVYLSAGMIP